MLPFGTRHGTGGAEVWEPAQTRTPPRQASFQLSTTDTGTLVPWPPSQETPTAPPFSPISLASSSTFSPRTAVDSPPSPLNRGASFETVDSLPDLPGSQRAHLPLARQSSLQLASPVRSTSASSSSTRSSSFSLFNYDPYSTVLHGTRPPTPESEGDVSSVAPFKALVPGSLLALTIDDPPDYGSRSSDEVIASPSSWSESSQSSIESMRSNKEEGKGKEKDKDKGRVFECLAPGCGKVFTTSGHLSRHRRNHMAYEERPFACPIAGCQLRFTRSDNLKSHYRSHAKREGITPAELPSEQLARAASTTSSITANAKLATAANTMATAAVSTPMQHHGLQPHPSLVPILASGGVVPAMVPPVASLHHLLPTFASAFGAHHLGKPGSLFGDAAQHVPPIVPDLSVPAPSHTAFSPPSPLGPFQAPPQRRASIPTAGFSVGPAPPWPQPHPSGGIAFHNPHHHLVHNLPAHPELELLRAATPSSELEIWGGVSGGF